MDEQKILRTARKAAGLAQHRLAAMIGMDQSTWCQIELGKRRLPEHYLAKLPPEIRVPLVRARIAELEKLL